MATFLVMQTRIANELQRSDLNTSPTQIKAAINSAANHYMNFSFWFNETSSTAVTVAGTQAYAWPTTMVREDAVKITANGTSTVLNKIGMQELQDLTMTTTSRGVPYSYTSYGSQFLLYPIPDAVYTLTYYYTKTYTELAADGDTNVWTTEAEELVRTRAKKLLALHSMHDYEMAAALDQAERQVFEALKQRTYADNSSSSIRAWCA